MNRKGILIPTVTIFGLIILLYAAFSVYTVSNDPATGKLGNLQYEIIKLQQQGEQRLFYVDQLAKYAGQNAIKELTQKKIEGCKILDTGNCNPQLNFEKNFEEEFKKEFFKLTENIYFDVPKVYDFEFDIQDEKIIVTGKTGGVLKLEKIEKYKIFYEVNPSFKQEIKYGLKDYKGIMDTLSDSKFIDCLRKDSNGLFGDKQEENSCEKHLSDRLKEDFEWNMKKNNHLVEFIVTSKQPLQPIGKLIYAFTIDLNKTPFLKIS